MITNLRRLATATVSGASGCLTLGVAVGLALLVLAKPAFRDVAFGEGHPLGLSVDFLDREGQPLGHRGILHIPSPPIGEISPRLVAAVLATEDRHFFDHAGLDPWGSLRAAVANALAGRVVQGGSTLTQQLAKDLFLGPERTMDRKIREAFLALWLEGHMSKAEILSAYLDRAYLGGGAYGVEAAARLYFGKSSRDLALPEAALLAGLLKAPSRYSPETDPDASAARTATVLDRMLAAGAITRAEHDDAAARPARVVARSPEGQAGHALDYAFREVQRLAERGAFGRSRDLTARTTVDAGLQARSAEVVRHRLAESGARQHVGEAAVLALSPDGEVLAMVGGRDYGGSRFNRTTDARRQPGSAFKPIVYAAAVAGTSLSPASTVEDAPLCIAGWCPRNYGGGFAGRTTLTGALARSLNTVAVRLSVDIGEAAGLRGIVRQAAFGRSKVIGLATRLGMATPLVDVPALPLGASEVTAMDLARGFAVFANGGWRIEPHSVLSVAGPDGATLWQGEPPKVRVLGPGLVADMNGMLSAVVRSGTGRPAAIPGVAVAGKTGTSSLYRDAWFVGFTPGLVAAVWLGNDDNSPMRGVTGGSLPARIWREIAGAAPRSRLVGTLPGLGERTPDGPHYEPSSPFAEPERLHRGFQVLSGGALP